MDMRVFPKILFLLLVVVYYLVTFLFGYKIAAVTVTGIRFLPGGIDYLTEILFVIFFVAIYFFGSHIVFSCMLNR
jgi:hypothetical protein